MDKEQILSTLKEKVGQTSFSERSLLAYVENNLPADGTEPDDAYWSKHTNVIKSFQGQFSADVASAVTTQLDAKVAEYYQKNPDKLKEYIKAHPELLTKPADEQHDEKYKELEAKIAKFEKEQEESKKLTLISGLRNQVLAKMAEQTKSKKVSINQKLWEHAVETVAYKENDTADTMYDSAKNLYESLFKMANGDTAKPFEVNSTSFISPNGNEAVKSYFAKKKAREGWGSK